MIGIGPGFRVGRATTQGVWVSGGTVGSVVAVAGNIGCCESPGNCGIQTPGFFVVGVGAVTVVVAWFAEELLPKSTTPRAPACASPSAVALIPRRVRFRMNVPNL